MKKDTFIVYTKYIDYARTLTDEEFGKIMRAVFEYAKTGKEPEEGELSVQAEMLFSIIKADVDIDTEKYKEKLEKRREAGRRGGIAAQNRRREDAEASSFEQNQANQANASFAKQIEQNQANQADNDNVSVSDNVGDNVDVGVDGNYNGEERRRLRPALLEYEKLIGPLTPRVAEVLDAYDFSQDLKILAIKTAHDNGARNLRYIEAVLEGYAKDGVKSAADVERINSQRKKSGKNAHGTEKRGSSGNYDFDEIERLEFERRMGGLNKSDGDNSF